MNNEARLWRLDCVAERLLDVPYPGQVLRAALGLALHGQGCSSGCASECRRMAGCAYHELFEPSDKVARFRLDLAAATWPVPPGGCWPIRVFTDDERVLDALELALYRGIGPERVSSRVRGRVVVRDGGDDPQPGELDLAARASSLLGRASVCLVTPAYLQRRMRAGGPSVFLVEPTLADVLHSARRRAEVLGWAAPEVPDVQHRLVRRERYRWTRWSARQGREVPMEGVRAEWRAVLDPRAAWLLAVAEVTGVGKHGTMGLGGVRVRPLHATSPGQEGL